MDEQLERLLYEEEGTALDFKRDQYSFEGADEVDKSELLKDILAFTNASRRSDAFILLGVEEVRGGRGVVHGICCHLQDAAVQQFVCRKTNRPVLFSCSVHVLDGKEVDVIRIPVQERPVFLTRDYGKVRANEVYVRRGSSTAVASPTEVAEMGRASGEIYPARPALSLGFGDPRTRASLGSGVTIEVCNLALPSEHEIPDFVLGGMLGRALTSPADRDYYRKYAKYLTDTRGLAPIWFYIENTGEVAAHDVRLEGQIYDQNRFFQVRDGTQLQKRPRIQTHVLALLDFASSVFSVDEDDSGWVVHGSLGKLQPKQRLVVPDGLFVGARHGGSAELGVKLFADNLNIPKEETMFIHVLVAHQTLTLEELYEIENQDDED